MFKQVDRQAVRKNKHFKIRKRISGTAERPRMSVYRSLSNIFVQLIDDVNKVTHAKYYKQGELDKNYMRAFDRFNNWESYVEEKQ